MTRSIAGWGFGLAAWAAGVAWLLRLGVTPQEPSACPLDGPWG